MVALLKQKSKVTVQQKPRKSFEAKDVWKRKKVEETVNPNVTVRQPTGVQTTKAGTEGRSGKQAS